MNTLNKYTQLLNKKGTVKIFFLSFLLLFMSCQVQFKMNGASIDYTQIKSITIIDFPNRATLVYAPLESRFNEALKDIYSRQTRLNLVSRNGDLQLEGEITNYYITPMAVGSDGFSQETKLSVTINVRFVNNKDHTQDFETTMSADRNFTGLINDAQDELITQIVEELTENIYNRTVANW